MMTGLTMPQPSESMGRLDARFAALFCETRLVRRPAASSMDTLQEIKELNLLLQSKSAKAANLP